MIDSMQQQQHSNNNNKKIYYIYIYILYIYIIRATRRAATNNVNHHIIKYKCSLWRPSAQQNSNVHEKTREIGQRNGLHVNHYTGYTQAESRCLWCGVLFWIPYLGQGRCAAFRTIGKWSNRKNGNRCFRPCDVIREKVNGI